jgi:CheY-like chemotaxis protein
VLPARTPSRPFCSNSSGRRILVVDDEPVNREVAKMLIEDIGLNVDTAENGEQAVAMAAANAYAAILMDMQMPNWTAWTPPGRSARFPAGGVPIIAMTANAFAEDKARCASNAGMDDFLAKPFDPNALFSTLLHWLGKHDA